MWKKAVRWIALLVAALLVAGLVRLCWVTLVEIPGDGGRPVFLPGDRVAVNKTAYGLRFWPMRRLGYVRWGACKPERGEWMAFNDPSGADSGQVHRQRPAGRDCRMVELPRKDAYVTITPDNIHWYQRMINLHEGAYATIIADSLCVSGHFVPSFRFSHDYYWVAAASPRGGADSRTFGFVPETHLIGRVSSILYSIDPEEPFYRMFRKGRFFCSP